ncbi:IGPS-domain-containing protein [Ceraceosorus guamensis]|uniref:Multifunctional tryptophan biosynthesis protein n=1 Tax=Ceraceosorus guamensis TaxID=1522189 RepID=A0A316VTJ1_9BASI|nr:IGPS-domain-containing protein [Ceraceosorus guamensis]PWN40358.1 IGPS-domain-containing protein [Ceraceosorus guamensis]
MPEYISPGAGAGASASANDAALPSDGLVGADQMQAATQGQSAITLGKTVLIDNYDSFTYNVVEFLSELGADLIVYRNDKVTLEEIEAVQPVNIVISPGPGHPLHDSGISIPLIKHFAGRIPILGVCMGLQCIYSAYTGVVEFAGEILHGKTSAVAHDGRGLYAGLSPAAVVGTRYHSLAAQLTSLPRELVVTSKTESGVVMGIRHTRHTIEAVQYHPESILSRGGKEMFANFLRLRGGAWAENPQAGIDEAAIAQAEATKEPIMAMTQAGAPAPGAAAAATATAASAAAVAAAAANGNRGNPTAQNGSSSNHSANGAVGTILERIHVQRLKDIEAAKQVPGQSPRDLATNIDMHLAPPLIDFVARLTANASRGLPGVMAEMKRASPSKGDIDPHAHAGAQAMAYARGGANVISVLTEPKWFKGTLNDLTLARKSVDGMLDRPAILRKDFIVDIYQVLEARAAGADTLLLIVAMLTDAQLRTLYDASTSLGMEPLVEVNNPEEMLRAIKLGAKLIGVNNRNLHDFNVDMGTTSRLAEKAREAGVVLCALSGITGRGDVEKYLKEGVGAVLVGEALMRATDKRAFIHDLLGLPDSAASTQLASEAPAGPSSGISAFGAGVQNASASASAPLVKICGLQTVDAAVTATLAGADMLGMILAPGTKRTVPLAQASEIINVVRSLRGGQESVRSAVSSLTAKQALSDAQAQAAGSGAVGSDALTAAMTHVAGQDWFEYQADLIRSHPHKPLIAGVFRDQPLSEVVQTATALKLDVVQLHGRVEEVEWSKYLPGVIVIRVFHVGPNDGPGSSSLREANRPGYHHISALDTAGTASSSSGGNGGTGQTFDWAVANRFARSDAATARVPGAKARVQPLILAGGLSAENVAMAAKAVGEGALLALDTSSGVETDGRKDAAKIQAFCKAAKEAFLTSST